MIKYLILTTLIALSLADKPAPLYKVNIFKLAPYFLTLKIEMTFYQMKKNFNV